MTASDVAAPAPGTDEASLGLRPDDLLRAAALSRDALLPLAEADWGQPAYDLEWTCWRTLQHMTSAVDWYSMLLAAPSQEPFRLRLLPQPEYSADHSLTTLLAMLERKAAVLAIVAASADPSARGFHVWGQPDPTGYIAMGCTEILLHTDDILRGHGQMFEPPDDLCHRLVARLFPWTPADVHGWAALNWLTGRVDLDGHERVPADWAWHASPLADWDGTIRTRGSYDIR
jgi:hypothetical protein